MIPVGKIELNIEGIDQETTLRYQEILMALVASGGLSGVKGGSTTIHFDGEGIFKGIQLNYWPFRRRIHARNT